MNIEPLLPTIYGVAISLTAMLLLVSTFYALNYFRLQGKNKTLQWLAELSYGYAEKNFHQYLSGEDKVSDAKFKAACSFLATQAKKYGINVSTETIVSAVQWAYQRLEGIPKIQGTIINTQLTGAEELVDKVVQQKIDDNVR